MKVMKGLGKPLPPVWYIQADNSPKEIKNTTVVTFLSLLVKVNIVCILSICSTILIFTFQIGMFRKIKLGFEIVGHTHEDVDQMFSGTCLFIINIMFVAYHKHVHPRSVC